MNPAVTTTEAIIAKISDLIVANTGIAAEKITPTSRFQDLGLDSLDALSLINDLEEEYGIKIPNQEVLKIKTVGEAVESLGKRI